MKDLRKMKNDELRDIAREYCIVGAWKMTKDKLIENILKSAELNGHTDKYYDSQNEPELTEESKSDKLLDKEEEAIERNQEPSNGWEMIAKKQLKNAYDQIVGGYENSVTDGEMTLEEFDEWLKNGAIDEVYHEAITTQYHEDACGGPAPTEMRFTGKEFCYDYLETLFKRDGYKNASRKLQNALYDISDNKSSNLSAKSEEVSEQPQKASKLKGYGAWVVDRETKELTTVIGEAESREDFYLSIKGKYRVRLITKPEKLEEECEQWKVRHAHNLVLKHEKYTRDKAEAEKMKMNVAEYRKWLRESAKTGK